MGMYYCHGCDYYHDSKSDAGYNETPDHRSFCDETMPVTDEQCTNPVWHDVFGNTPRIPTIDAIKTVLSAPDVLRRVPNQAMNGFRISASQHDGDEA